jgi:pimeloyl-ACP methyl ester carboxylesterase
MSMSRIAGPSGALAVADGGPRSAAALPVVFVHSLAGNARHWQAQLDHLRPHRRVIAFDFRGHGQSEPARNREYTIAALAGDIAAVSDRLGLDRFILVGHSMGGGASLQYAGDHPDRVAGLLLLDPIGDGTQITSEQALAFLGGLESNYDTGITQYWSQIAGPDSGVRDRLLADLRATPRDVVLAVLRDVMLFDPHPLLSRYQGPIMSVVTPQNDEGFSLHRLGKGFPHRVVTGTGHWIQLDKPEEVNQVLDEFLDRQ